MNLRSNRLHNQLKFPQNSQPPSQLLHPQNNQRPNPRSNRPPSQPQCQPRHPPLVLQPSRPQHRSFATTSTPSLLPLPRLSVSLTALPSATSVARPSPYHRH